jgi:RimJ/RimL family protein N-acetyltransferase
MTLTEFELMPHPFGWKAEYYGNQAHLTPRHHAIKTKLIVKSTAIKTTNTLKIIDPLYKPQMIAAFYEAFQDSVEFDEWEQERIKKYATKNITDYFAGIRGEPLANSIMAIDAKTDEVIGLALFLINKDSRWELDLLFVKSAYQRHGLGTQMVAIVLNHLHEKGVYELYSTYHICNEISRNWHQRFGFKEEYDEYFIRLKCAWYRQEIWRNQQLGLASELPELMKQKEYWHSQLNTKYD